MNTKPTTVNSEKYSNFCITSMKRRLIAMEEEFLELARNIKCECFPKMFKKGSNLINKLMWSFLFVTFSLLTLYMLKQNVFDYFK